MKNKLKFFKVEASGDALYFKATDLDEAKQKMRRFMGGDIPDELLTWTKLKRRPIGVEISG